MSHPQTMSRWRGQIELVLFALLLTAGAGFILASDLLLTRRVNVEPGQAASEDITAPHRIEFVSKILTDAERIHASADVAAVYDPLDRQAGREQVNLAQQVLSFVDSVRSDPYASPTYQRFCLQSIQSVRLSLQVISDTLALVDDEWKVVQQETRRVLDLIMREEIKTGQEDRYRRGIRALIAFELSEPQTAIVNEIAGALVRANSVYNAQATEAARQAAIEAVQPQMRVLEENEMIVRSGQIVTELNIEAMDALGLLTSQVNWLTVSATCLFVLLLAISASTYLWYGESSLLRRPHHLLLLLLLLVLFTFLAKWGTSQPVFPSYLIPLATLGMLVTALFNIRLGLIAHVIISLIVGYVTGGQLGPLMYHLCGGLIGIFALRRVNRTNTFIWAGAYVMLSNIVTAVTFALLGGELDTFRLGELVVVGIANGAFSAVLTLGGYYLLGMTFRIMTTLQLLDLARPTQPLMRQLLVKAPGTYHHSIMVSNMAEQAAEAIGADALLARVGAFYHDVGKTVRPYFFTENQMENSNPHDLIDPETSVQIIRSHTHDGLELARKYRLPYAIQAFITEHHGTAKIGYFMNEAIKEYGPDRVKEEDYRHAGPRPQSKETAIVMLADTCEAAVRSVRPHDDQEMEELIRRLISKRIASGQLNDAPLTLREIETITLSFIGTLRGVFHPRIRYPSEENVIRTITPGTAIAATTDEAQEQPDPSPPVTSTQEANTSTTETVPVKEAIDDSSLDSPGV